MMQHVTAGIGLALFMVSGAQAPPPRSPAGGNQIAWVQDLPTAQRLARAQHKLVLQFLMLGDLPDPHC